MINALNLVSRLSGEIDKERIFKVIKLKVEKLN